MKKKIVVIAGVCVAVVILLEITLRLTGPALLLFKDSQNKRHLWDKDSFRVLCIGESTTYGQYPSLLENKLNANTKGVRFKVIDKGVPAIKTETIRRQLPMNLDTYDPHIVVAMIGINDPGNQNILVSGLEGKGSFLSFLIRIKTVKLIWLVARQYTYHRLTAERSTSRINETVKLIRSRRGKAGGKSDEKAQLLRLQGRAHLERGDVAKAEECFMQALKRDPGDPNSLWDLARAYFDRGEFSRVEKIYTDLIRDNPGNSELNYVLGELYQEKGMFDKAIPLFRKAVGLNPGHYLAYLYLADVYRQQQRIAAAGDVLKEGVDNNPWSPALCGALGMHYMRTGNYKEAQRYLAWQTALLENRQNPITRKNYGAIVSEVASRGKIMICMQYPMRGIGPLKQMIGTGRQVVFIDNEKIFKDAVSKYGYRHVFRDDFAGDFGHCTAYGNSLIAENLSRGILSELGIR